MDKYKVLKQKVRKHLDIKTTAFVVFLALYICFYVFFREEHLFVHICHHGGGIKHYDAVRMNYPASPASLFLNWWETAFLIFIHMIYKPLMALEAFLHSLNLLPSSCPWK
ncbi:MAG: hypothetical protein GC137_10045 [Alphaproteobacteria bacterium]|nr:hypothetical protein [Alphaproteobacteria bacterium]